MEVAGGTRRARSRRAVPAGIVALALAAIALAPPPGPAAAAPDPAAARSSSAWLAAQLVDGRYANPLAPGPDHGLMIDGLFAMYASGDGRSAAPIVEVLDDRAEARDYFTYSAWLGEAGLRDRIGGATAKVLVAAQVSGRDPRDFGGYDMVAETQGVLTPDGPERGRVRDLGPHTAINNANTFGQALAVIGLAGAGASDPAAIAMLVHQQCAEGYFRIFYSYAADGSLQTCDQGRATGHSPTDGDSTGLALSALLTARRAGATGLDGPIGRAVAWLVAHQDPASGGWGGGVGTEAPNTNSTGLIVQALADAGGARAAVDRGRAYLGSAQATIARDAGNDLAGDIGAIAYNPAEYRAARVGGIGSLDTWIRAGAQASLGLSQATFFELVTGAVPPGPPTPTTTSPPTTPGSTTTTTARPPAGPGPSPSAGPGEEPPPPSPRAGDPGPRRNDRRGRVVTPDDLDDRDDRDGPGASDDPVAEAGSPTPAGRLGEYLAGQLVDGDHVEVEVEADGEVGGEAGGEVVVDYDATADLALALHALDEQPEARERVAAFLLDPGSVEAYAHGLPYEDEGEAAYAEPLAKLLAVARLAGADDDVVDPLAAALAGLGDDGAYRDTGEFADRTRATRTQAWAALALVAADDPGAAGDAVEVLLAARCDDGTFPATLAARSCRTGDLHATAWATVALNATPATGGDRPSSSRDDDTDVATVVATDVDALSVVAAALNDAAGRDGLVDGEGGKPDPVLTGAVAMGRHAAGLDTSATRDALAELVGEDGGLPADNADADNTDGDGDGDGDGDDGSHGSDLVTSLGAAPGLAGRSWIGAPGSPVERAVLLPVDTADRDDGNDRDEAAPAARRDDAGADGPWALEGGAIPLALGLTAAAAAGGTHLAGRRRRKPATAATTTATRGGSPP